jgi:glycosyltransferase involved in cell wall biosynthesis
MRGGRNLPADGAVAPAMTENQVSEERLAIIIPSLNRAAVLHETVQSFARQCRAPAEIIIAVPGDEHVLRDTRALPRVRVVRSAIGSSRQRNTAIAALSPEIGLVAFLDDDVELDADYLEQITRSFAARPDLVLADGRVLADGALAGPIARDSARAIIADWQAPAAPSGSMAAT